MTLLRISTVFADGVNELVQFLGAEVVKPLGSEYYLVKGTTCEAVRASEVGKFVRWNLPVDHAWPCNSGKMEGFVEKAAQTLLQKFGPRTPQGLFIGPINAGSPDPYYKKLASNLRGRALQLFPGLPVEEVEEQHSGKETLFCLVGKEGLYAGMSPPRVCNGFYPGGSMYAKHQSAGTISRAGAKIAEALHYLRLHRALPKRSSRWLELGASPGGMTSELLGRGYLVTAIDVAAMHEKVMQNPRMKFVQSRVEDFNPPPNWSCDAILSDMNGVPFESMEQVIRLSRWLVSKGLIVFTLKMPKIESISEPLAMFGSIVADAKTAGLRLFAQTHLTYNRHEFTLFFEKP